MTEAPQLLQGKVVVLSGVGPGSDARSARRRPGSAPTSCSSRGPRSGWTRWPRWSGRTGAGRSSYPPTSTTRTPARRWSTPSLEEYGRVDCLINNAFAIPPMEPLTTLKHDALRRSLETNAFAPLRLSTLFADALAETPDKPGLDHHGQLRGAAAVAARVRRLQDDQGHAGAHRLVAGHRARPARHPGQLRGAELDLRGRQQGLLRLDGRRSAASPTTTSTARSPTRPTSSGWPRPRRSPRRRSSSPPTWPRRSAASPST